MSERVLDYRHLTSKDLLPGRWLRRFSKLLVLATLSLIFIGSLVTSTGSGLSVPDWPETFGHFMFSFPLNKMIGGIFYEHGHRLVASVVGLITLIMAFWILIREKRKWVKVFGMLALVLVIAQGVLGGVTVRYYLPTAVSVMHAVMAQTFFLLTIFISYSLSKERYLRHIESQDVMTHFGFGKFALILTGLIYIQLIVGAVLRHTYSGLSILDIPTMAGGYLPWVTSEVLAKANDLRYAAGLAPVAAWQVAVHMAHRLMGVLIGVYGLVFFAAIMKSKLPFVLRRQAFWMLMIVFTQVSLGFVTVYTQKQYIITSVHVVTGALLLGLSFLLTLRLYPLAWKDLFWKLEEPK